MGNIESHTRADAMEQNPAIMSALSWLRNLGLWCEPASMANAGSRAGGETESLRGVKSVLRWNESRLGDDIVAQSGVFEDPGFNEVVAVGGTDKNESCR